MADKGSRKADFVARVVGDANNPPDARMLTGWLGDAGEEGKTRLYTNPDLSRYVDIPDDAILHTEPIRDSQPPGGVFVWVRRDAAITPGGTAAGRAARFLQGQLQEDFASGNISPEKFGMHCVTQPPCAEPTGFSGLCTKQPDVGGGWPCITTAPFCSEITGFTGQCTHRPWPNPTKYIGCTFVHCPTRADLTCIPRICQIVEQGIPQNAVAADRPATAIPGCGYTQYWGFCPTLPIICGCVERTNLNPCVERTNSPDKLAADVVTGPQPSIGIICPTPDCQTQPPTALCTQWGPDCPTPFCPTQTPQACPCTTPPEKCPTGCGVDCQTPQPACTQCNCTQAGPQCPSPGFECTFTCPPTAPGVICPNDTSLPNCWIDDRKAAVRAAAAAPAAITGAACPTPVAICPTVQEPGCPTYPNGDCTFFGCPTKQQPGCPTYPNGDCTFFNCPTQFKPCPTVQQPGCPTYPNGDCTFFNCPSQFKPCPTKQQPCTFAGPGCPPTPATVCTQFPPCPTYPNGDCTFFNCPSRFQPCPTKQQPCTFFGAGCPPTPATVCTQFPPCPTVPRGDCTFFNCPTNIC